MHADTCETCIWWDQEGKEACTMQGEEVTLWSAECRARPPVMFGGTRGRFPTTYNTEWCKELETR